MAEARFKQESPSRPVLLTIHGAPKQGEIPGIRAGLPQSLVISVCLFTYLPTILLLSSGHTAQCYTLSLLS